MYVHVHLMEPYYMYIFLPFICIYIPEIIM